MIEEREQLLGVAAQTLDQTPGVRVLPRMVDHPVLHAGQAAAAQVGVTALHQHPSSPQPPTGMLGLTPQKKNVKPSLITIVSTSAVTMDLAVAAPTPTGPPRALNP